MVKSADLTVAVVAGWWLQCWWPSDSHGDGLVVLMAIGRLRRRQWLWWWEAKTQLEAKSKLRRWAPIVGRGLAQNQKPQKWEGSGFEIRSSIWVLHSCTLLSFHFIDFYGKSLPLMKFQSFEGLAIVGSQGIPDWNTDLSVQCTRWALCSNIMILRSKASYWFSLLSNDKTLYFIFVTNSTNISWRKICGDSDSDFYAWQMWRILKFLYIWSNFKFLHMTDVGKFKFSPYDM